MDDAGAMGRVERVGDFDPKGERLVQRHGTLRKPVGQRLAFEELEDEEAVADVEQRADVRVRELRDCPGFAVEPLPELGIGGERGRQDLDRHRAIEPRVTGSVDLAHSARAERRGELVGTETCAGGEGQRSGL